MLSALHKEKLATIVEEVKRRPSDKRLSIRKATPAHQLHNRSWKDSCHLVDVAPLNEIVEFKEGIDRRGEKTMLAVCEGQVTLQQLVEASFRIGYVPQVVPEYPDFTIAGLVNGEGIQTSCHKYGLFTHTITEIEVVLGNGEVRIASESADKELFAFLPASYGTLGIVTCATVALRPALPFVRTRYSGFSNIDAFIERFEKMVRTQQGDFLEGLVFGPSCYVIVESYFCSADEAKNFATFDPTPLDCSTGDEYYYMYLQNHIVDKSNGYIKREMDVIPTPSFVFRSCKGFYWMLETYLNHTPLLKYRWFRALCDRKSVTQMKRSGFEAQGKLSPEEIQRCLVMQDMGVMLKRLREGIEWVQARLGVYPLWICPICEHFSAQRGPLYVNAHPSAAKALGDDFLCDIGIYGEPSVHPFYHRRVVRDLQQFVDSPSWWGVCYEDPKTIRSGWEPIREKFHANEAFVSMDEKITFRGKDEDGASTETSIPYWRLVNDHGWYWWIKLPVLGSVVIGLIAFGIGSLMKLSGK